MFDKIYDRRLDVIMLQFVFGDLMVISPSIGRRVRLLVSWVTMGCPTEDLNAVQTYSWVCTDLAVLLDRELDWNRIPTGDPQRLAFALVEEINDTIRAHLKNSSRVVRGPSDCEC